MTAQRPSRILGPLAMAVGLACLSAGDAARGQDEDLRNRAEEAMRRAAAYYRGRVASHGGYVYHYGIDLGRRWGEGEATADQVWVQPPGTPAVGMAYLEAYEATGDRFYLDAAREAGEALAYGQLESGGWTNAIDFDPRGERVARYRGGRGRGRNDSTLDDDITQAAIRFLARLDRALGFDDRRIHETARTALDALLAAQFANGGFPQVWDGPVEADRPVVPARYPEHDWRTEGRIKDYWDLYTLNDGLAGTVARTLIEAGEIYDDARCREALARFGGFLILAQMPDPQPAWAQQYNFEMEPVWARAFEPPAVSGGESQDVVEALLRIARTTGDRHYLEPIPRALSYLGRSQLPDGRLARFYELRTNTPLYMERRGGAYTLTHDDSNLPDHYGWKVPSRLDALRRAYNAAATGRGDDGPPLSQGRDLDAEVRRILADLDAEGRWIRTYAGERLVGQPKFPTGMRYLSSEVFVRNLETLGAYLKVSRPPGSSPRP